MDEYLYWPKSITPVSS